MRSVPVFLFTASLLALPSCGDDKDDSTGLSSGTADTTTGAPQPTSSTGTTSVSTTAPDDTTTAGTSGSETSPTTGGSSSSGEADTTTTGDTTGSTTDATTGDPVACADLGPMQCADNAACWVIEGGKLNLEKECVGKTMFFECSGQGVCGGAVTYACAPDTDPPEPFMFASTCLPAGWQECEAPPIEVPCK